MSRGLVRRLLAHRHRRWREREWQRRRNERLRIPGTGLAHGRGYYDLRNIANLYPWRVGP